MSIADKILRAKEDYDNVYDAGKGKGYTEGYARGFDEGKKTEYDAFWDEFQLNGTRTNYSYAFAGSGWHGETFKPKYKIVLPSEGYNVQGVFFRFGDESKPTIDYRTIADKIDTTQITSAQNLFNSAKFNYIDVDLSNCNTLYMCFRAEWHRTYTTHIEVKVSEKCTDFSYAFDYQWDLTDLTFKDGSVIVASIVLSDCPLSRESIENIVTTLSTTSSGKTLTLNADAVHNAFTDAEWSALKATRPNWSFNV